MFFLTLPLGFVMLIGAIFTGVDIYRFLRKHPTLGRTPHTAVTTSVVTVTVMAGLMAAPYYFSPYGVFGLGGWVRLALAAMYVLFLVIGVRHILKWVGVIRKSETDCGCDGKASDKK